MLVRATARGFDGVKLRRSGDIFDYEGEKLSWAEPVEQSELQPRAAVKSQNESRKDTHHKDKTGGE